MPLCVENNGRCSTYLMAKSFKSLRLIIFELQKQITKMDRRKLIRKMCLNLNNL